MVKLRSHRHHILWSMFFNITSWSLLIPTYIITSNLSISVIITFIFYAILVLNEANKDYNMDRFIDMERRLKELEDKTKNIE